MKWHNLMRHSMLPWPDPVGTGNYSLRHPDRHEQRDDRHLLVWGDLPHWMVVDDEFYRLLHRFDGGLPLRDVVQGIPSASGGRADAMRALKRLKSIGILTRDTAGRRRERKPPSPRIENISINVTACCNLRCRFCYNLDRLAMSDEGELTADEMGAFLSATRRNLGRRPTLSLLGGEPLRRDDVVLAVAARARHLGFASSISTNGTLVTDAFARSAKRIGLQVQVSVDGATAETNDATRGAGTFEKAISGIRRLVSAGTHTVLCFVCHTGNIHELRNYFDLAREIGVPEVRFIPLKPTFRGSAR